MNSLIVGPPGSGKSRFILKNKIINDFNNKEPMIIFNENNEIFDLVKDDIPKTKRVMIFSPNNSVYYDFFEKYKDNIDILNEIVSVMSNTIDEKNSFFKTEQEIILFNLMKLLNYNKKDVSVQNIYEIITDDDKIQELCIRLFSCKDVSIENLDVAENISNVFKNYNPLKMLEFNCLFQDLNHLNCFNPLYTKFKIHNFMNKDDVLFININNLFSNKYNKLIYKFLFMDLIKDSLMNFIPINIYIDDSKHILDNSSTISYFKLPMKFINIVCSFNSFDDIKSLTKDIGTDIFLNSFKENYISTYNTPNEYITNYAPLEIFKKYKGFKCFIFKDFFNKNYDYKILDFK